VADVTGFPEMMDGRVKTLHPKVHGGLLALRDKPEHVAAMENTASAPSTFCREPLPVRGDRRRRRGLRHGDREHRHRRPGHDPGGGQEPRACGRRRRPEDYEKVIAALDAHDGGTPYDLRQSLALTAYARTAAYDAAVSTWLAKATDEATPRRRAFAGTLAAPLRYGENPHQSAAFYTDGTGRPGVATATQHQGKELSYNNINDTDAAFELVSEFHPDDGPVCAIIKHANPCGVARGATLAEAYSRAFDCDRTSAFGGIVALNRTLDAETAERIVEIFTEVVIAPDATEEAKAVFAAKKNLRLLTTGGLPSPHGARRCLRQVSGGILVQDKDVGRIEEESCAP
jgi:phosphoribosylaminoimidazolecarboxamide formyltransferase/IMP cyclohydrolase